MKTGGGAVDWNEMDDVTAEFLGKENPSLTSIAGGIDSGESSVQKVDMGNLSEIDEAGTDVAEDETDTNSSKDRKEEETQQEDGTPENKLEAKDPVGDEKTSYGQIKKKLHKLLIFTKSK
jgi:hypothetical protein